MHALHPGQCLTAIRASLCLQCSCTSAPAHPVLPSCCPGPFTPTQAATCERKVRVFDLERDVESTLPEADTLVSMSLSRSGRHLLVSLTSCSMRLWDLGADRKELRLPAMPCATYQAASVSGRKSGWGRGGGGGSRLQRGGGLG